GRPASSTVALPPPRRLPRPPASTTPRGRSSLIRRKWASGGSGSPRCMALEDAHGRLLGDLRVSVTDRCNFRCHYCMPAEGMPWIDRAELLSFAEIERLGRRVVGLGVKDVRLTGGEPLVRREFPALVGRLA